MACLGLSLAVVFVLPLVARARSPEGPEYVRSIGSLPPLGYLNNPMGVAVSPAEDGRIYVADTDNARIHVFSRSGQPLGVWGERGDGPGKFWRPTDVATTVDGRYVFVVDQEQGVLQRFAPRPECFVYRSLACFEGAGVLVVRGSDDEGGALRMPTAVAVDAAGDVYVSDVGTDLIQVFSTDGVWLRSFGGAGTDVGQLNYPADLAVAPDGLVVVADRDNDRLAWFTDKGEVVTVYNAGARLFRPTGVAVDYSGGFAVRDYDPSFSTPRLWRFDSERRLEWMRDAGQVTGEYMFPPQGAAFLPNGGLALTDPTAEEIALAFLEPDSGLVGVALRGKEPKQFDHPSGVAIDPYFLVVSDQGNKRVTVLGNEDKTIAVIGGDLNPDIGFVQPAGVAVWRGGDDPNDARIYVADRGANAVIVLSPRGEVLDRWGGFGNAPDQLYGPSDVAVTDTGEVLIADTNNNRIVMRAPDGTVLGTIQEEPGELEFPSSVAVGPLGYIYVLEARRNRLQAFRLDGTRVFKWETEGNSETTAPGDLWLPVAVEGDSRFVYILENNGLSHVRVQVFEVEKPYPDNVFTIFANDVGAGPGQLWNPAELAVSPDGRIVIADSGNDRVALYVWPGETPVWTPSPTPTPTDPPWPTETPTLAPTATPVEPGATSEPPLTPEATSTPPLPTRLPPNVLPTDAPRSGTVYLPATYRH